jgi:rubrerythrin
MMKNTVAKYLLRLNMDENYHLGTVLKLLKEINLKCTSKGVKIFGAQQHGCSKSNKSVVSSHNSLHILRVIPETLLDGTICRAKFNFL